MPNPHTAGPGDGCMVHAGILTPHGGDPSKAELTSGFPEAAKERFIKEVIDELTGAAENNPVAFPCGTPIKPLPKEQADLFLDLANEEKYPAFHKDILGHYKEIAQKLDKESNLSLLPVCDPIALGTKMGINIKIGSLGELVPFLAPCPPLVAAKLAEGDMGMTPIKFAAKLPGLIAGAQIPPKIDLAIDLPTLPELTVPGIPNLLDFKLALVTGFPSFIGELLGNIPSLALQIMTGDIPGALGEVCKIINEDSKLFGETKKDEDGDIQDTIQNASRKVLARKTAEMSLLVAMSQTLGTSPGGLTGNFARSINYAPPTGAQAQEEEEPMDDETMVRDMLSSAMDECAGLYWGSDQEAYSRFLFPQEFSTGLEKRAIDQGRVMSSCGMTARAILARGGAVFYYNENVKYFSGSFPEQVGSPGKHVVEKKKKGMVTKKEYVFYDFFNDIYKGGVLEALMAAGVYRNAMLTPVKNNNPANFGIPELPPLKRGDVIVVQRSGNKRNGSDHVIVVEKDYNPGDPSLYTVEGGSSDPKNMNAAGCAYAKRGPLCSGIRRKSYHIQSAWPSPTVDGKVRNWALGAGGNYVFLASGVGAMGLERNPDNNQMNVMLQDRFVIYCLDAYKLIRGGSPLPGQDASVPKKSGRDAVNPTAVTIQTDASGGKVTSDVGGDDIDRKEFKDENGNTVQPTSDELAAAAEASQPPAPPKPPV